MSGSHLGVRWWLVALCFIGGLASGTAALAQEQESPGVARWAFTSEIRDREPIDRLDRAPESEAVVYFFTELRGLDGVAVQHIWLRDDVEVFRLAFDVGGPRWRVYSSKRVDPGAVWTVKVEDETGTVLASHRLGEGGAATEPVASARPLRAGGRSPIRP